MLNRLVPSSWIETKYEVIDIHKPNQTLVTLLTRKYQIEWKDSNFIQRKDKWTCPMSSVPDYGLCGPVINNRMILFVHRICVSIFDMRR